MLTTRTVFATMFLVSGLAALAGCGKSAPGAPNFDPATGKHTPVDWASNHGTTFIQYRSQCQNCHGLNLLGGTSGVSCDKCHQAPHPKFFALSSHARLQPLQNTTNNCTPCHGDAFQGGKTAPACSKCHVQLITPVRGECVSCHGKNGPDGTTEPNVAGAHPAHLAHNLACDVCHKDGGPGKPNHGTIIQVQFSSAVNLKPGTTAAVYEPTTRTCSNVSCHGGIIAPNWRTGNIDANSACVSCHNLVNTTSGQGRNAYNSYSSGHHAQHNFGCINCHDIAKLNPGTQPAHFSNLLTHTLELSPASTLKDIYNGSAQTCLTPTANGCHPTTTSPAWRSSN